MPPSACIYLALHHKDLLDHQLTNMLDVHVKNSPQDTAYRTLLQNGTTGGHLCASAGPPAGRLITVVGLLSRRTEESGVKWFQLYSFQEGTNHLSVQILSHSSTVKWPFRVWSFFPTFWAKSNLDTTFWVSSIFQGFKKKYQGFISRFVVLRSLLPTKYLNLNLYWINKELNSIYDNLLPFTV